ncbi:MAG: hypothetical protein LUC37_05325 [Prevotella sp.]|nr:hypothetical protein [Prevotella sp.]
MSKFIFRTEWYQFFDNLNYAKTGGSGDWDKFILENLKELLFMIDAYVNRVPLVPSKEMYIAEAVFMSIRSQIDKDLMALKETEVVK